MVQLTQIYGAASIHQTPPGIHYFCLLSSVKVVGVELKGLFNLSQQLNLVAVCVSRPPCQWNIPLPELHVAMPEKVLAFF